MTPKYLTACLLVITLAGATWASPASKCAAGREEARPGIELSGGSAPDGSAPPAGVEMVFVSQTQAECEQNCNDQLNYCTAQCNGAEDCVEWCEQYEYALCMENCPCDDQPTVVEWTETDRVAHSGPHGITCRVDVLFPWKGAYYELYEMKDRTRTFRKTTDCRGNSTTSVIAISYSSPYYCYLYLGNTCTAQYPTPACVED
jgi:hypothetical protein